MSTCVWRSMSPGVTIAPLDAYRVVIQVDERDIAYVQVGQTGRIALTGRPGTPLGFKVGNVTAISYDRTPWGLLGSLQYYLYGDNRNPTHRNRIRHSALLWLLGLPLTLIISLLHRSDIMTVVARKGASR